MYDLWPLPIYNLWPLPIYILWPLPIYVWLVTITNIRPVNMVRETLPNLRVHEGVGSDLRFIHNCTQFLCCLDGDDQYRGPSMNNRDHLIGWNTTPDQAGGEEVHLDAGPLHQHQVQGQDHQVHHQHHLFGNWLLFLWICIKVKVKRHFFLFFKFLITWAASM